MKRSILIICLIFFICSSVFARHIKGGWIQYEYVGVGTTAGTSVYKITVNVFRSCTDNGPMPGALGIYDAVTNTNVQTISGTANSYTLVSVPTKTSFDPCLSNPPTICYQVLTYTTTVTLADNTNGYIIAAQDAFRINGIQNIVNSSATGISFTATIPGTVNGTDYHINSSPFFAFKDTVVVCYNAKFTYQFNATDADGDSLSYSFGNGINGASNLTAPPYSAISYASGYSGSSPLGAAVSIDSLTGLISGTAPAANGDYVIAVYVTEWRKGVKINSTKKELQINVADCSLSAAALKNVYLNCTDYTMSFQNESSSSNITSYLWDFGVTTSSKDTSSSPTPSFTYADTGVYTIKLVVSNSGGCKDSATAPTKIYPGFTPAFTATGTCYQTPIQFADNSLVKYGTISSLLWDFGDTTTTTDTSSASKTSYKYPNPGNVTAVLTISSSVGCSGSISKTITINDKPYLYIPFTDTLICSIDSLPINAQGTGTFKWSPSYNISNTNILTPVVYPKDSTVYTLTVTDQGCIDSAKVQVNVLKFITVKLGLDTGICKTDSLTLRPVSDALSYKWRESTNAGSLNSNLVKYPKAAPLVTTIYYVTANLGYCQDSAKIKVNVSPYPMAILGKDTTICFGNRIQLNGNFQGTYFTWSPTASLVNDTTISPIAGPSKTTAYIFTAKDTLYCPKQVSDTILVTVVPPFTVNAGHDTSVSVGQPLQLSVSGGDSGYSYHWDPSSFLDNSSIYNPLATINSSSIDSIRYYVTVTSPNGCVSTDNVLVTVFKGGPEIYVPSGFTPNGDGKNDILKPILVGITKLNNFTIYDRWGKIVFNTSEINAGWDGTFHGYKQDSGAYVYTVQGTDYTGKPIFRKGTVVLIR